MAVIPIVHSDNHIHDCYLFIVPIDQLFKQKSHHHQMAMQTQIGFDGYRNYRNL
jgi:hypothetical protein